MRQTGLADVASDNVAISLGTPRVGGRMRILAQVSEDVARLGYVWERTGYTSAKSAGKCKGQNCGLSSSSGGDIMLSRCHVPRTEASEGLTVLYHYSTRNLFIKSTSQTAKPQDAAASFHESCHRATPLALLCTAPCRLVSPKLFTSFTLQIQFPPPSPPGPSANAGVLGFPAGVDQHRPDQPCVATRLTYGQASS